MSIGSGKRIKVAEVGDLPVGEGRVIEAEGRTLALFNVDGTFYAIDNTCPHRGGPLGEGDLQGRYAICPWHAWRWDVTTGSNANNPAVLMPDWSGYFYRVFQYPKQDWAYTLEALQAPDRTLFLVLGADAVANMGTWRRLDDTRHLAEIVVVERTGDLEVHPPGDGWCVHHVAVPRLDISSTDLRSSSSRPACGPCPESCCA